MQEKLAILLSRKLSGEATTHELNELEDWIKAHPEDHYLIELIELYWHNNAASSHNNTIDNEQFERILNSAADLKHLPKVSTQGISGSKHLKVLRIKRFTAAAAVIAGLVIVTIFLINRKNHSLKNMGEESVFATSSGTKSQILLPDGSKVWLNAATQLHYNRSFNGKLREVYLNGEAYFDVRKDKSRPFIVHTSDIDVCVLGTTFNVKSYNDDAAIETTLINGSIKVISNKRKDVGEIILHPNEKLVFAKYGNIVTIPLDEASKHEIINSNTLYQVSKIMPDVNDSVVAETAWMQNQLLFDGDTFKELAVKMERWFAVKINFENDEVAAYRLRGAFEDETIDEALRALQQIANFKYVIKDKTVTIYK